MTEIVFQTMRVELEKPTSNISDVELEFGDFNEKSLIG